MKKLVFALIVLLYSVGLMGQIEMLDLKEKYDSIPITERNYKFVKAINYKFNSLVKEGADSIMLYYDYEPGVSGNIALIVFKKKKQCGSIAFYQYVSKARVVSEILNSTILDTTNIFAFYSIFRKKEVRTMDTIVLMLHIHEVFGKFYFGKSTKLYAGFDLLVSARTDREFQKAYMKEEDRILVREKKIYESKNK
jgi:hypothetical protein